MSTKEEELKAFERLKNTFPERNVELSLHYSSWHKEPYYYCYVGSAEGRLAVSGLDKTTLTPSDAVDYIIRKEEETNAEKEATSVDKP
uniref:Uncharacterized protein n=1 Tax=viral metagenome TaxID=1070528 RepID=A0A6M3LQ64_9ZZZZ